MINKVLRCLVTVVSLLIIALCILVCYRFIDIRTTVTMIIFNLFFISLYFQLSGSPTVKVVTLTAGNILGLFWNFMFHFVSLTGNNLFGVIFNSFFAVFFPILNLMWVVSFWSISLSFLPKLQTTVRKVKL